MFTKLSKQLLAVLLVLMMVVTMIPVSVFAAEHEHTTEVAENTDAALSETVVDTELLEQVKAQMDALLTEYLGKTVLSEEETFNALVALDGDTLWNLWLESEELVGVIETMSEAEFAILLEYESTETFGYVYDTLYQMVNPPIMLLTTVDFLDGKLSLTDTANTITVSGSTVTATAKGSLFGKKSSTITIVNETADVSALSFDYTVTASSAFTIDGASAATSGTYTATLDPGASVVLVITSNSGLSNTTVTLTMSNVSLTTAAASSMVTVDYDSTYGSVTAGGSAVESGAQVEASLADGISLVATPVTGATFLGWADAETGRILSTAATYSLKPTADVTVKAVFIGANSAPHFYLGPAAQKSQSSGLLGLGKLYYYTVGTTHIFDDLNAAASVALTSSSKTIVLANTGTLPAGTYTIPAGVTLLIPFDNANTLYTTQAVGIEDPNPNQGGVWAAPTEFRKLTMAEGANLIVNGAMSLSCKHTYAQGSRNHGGSPTGPVSFVKMENNSTITVNNGGTLYAYGYIYGNGSVTVKSGGTVYENFQITDFRGGTQSTDMDNGVFPLSQYYVQNVEVPMTIEYGATEYSYTTVYMSSADFGSAVAFFASSGAMFNLTSGNVVKRYDGSTDRLIIDLNGNMTVSSIEMKVGTSSINSKDYELPVTNNITVNVKSGSNINLNQDISLLPGSVINVDNGATCVVGSGYNVYAYDADQWGGYTSPANKPFIPAGYSPSRTHTRTNADLVDATIRVDGTFDASAGYVYTTAGGANVYSTGTGVGTINPGSETLTYQMIQAQDTANTTYAQIPLTSAKLKNADGTYTETAGTAGIYTYTNGVWIKECTGEHSYTETITTPAGCESEGLKTYTCTCGDTYTEVIPATGHTPGAAADCNNAQTCTVCGEELAPSTGHTPVVDEAVAPTCTETGLTEGSHCSVCGETIVAQEVVPAAGHTPGAAADCNNAQTCTVCGEELAPATGHTPVVDEAVAPTCTETGLTEGSHCSVCGETIVAQEVVPATGHTPVVDEAVAPTCTATGLTEGSHCSVCGETIVAQEVVPATGHTPVVDEAVAPTCTETGLTEGSHCSVCGETIVAQEVVHATGHTPVVDEAVAPT
ncbi:MAG: hypothetical protein IJD19_03940, partial [Ruminococcus sp.]|nr:hypothetical protein [Ruminococcus sp.]